MKTNPFALPLHSLFRHYLELNHVLQLSEHYGERAAKEARSFLKQLKAMPLTPDRFQQAYFSGASLALVDLFSPQKDTWLYDTHSLASKRLASMPIELARRNNALVLVDVFESMERFLKAIYAPIVRLAKLRLRETKQFDIKVPESRKCVGTPRYYELYARHVCRRNCDLVLTYLESNLPWEQIEFPNFDRLTFRETMGAVGSCRQLIVHSSGTIDEEQMVTLNKHQRQLIESLLCHSRFHRAHQVLPSREFVECVIEYFASIAAVFYRLLSEKFELPMQWQLKSWRLARD